MSDALWNLWQATSLAKVVYTLILIFLIIVLAAEVRRLWFDRTTYIRPFEFIEAGKAVEGSGESFAARVIDYHNALRQQLAVAQGSLSEAERSWSPMLSDEEVKLPKSVLTELDVKVQDVNITDILGRLRNWVSTPVEITGTVFKTGNQYRTSFTIPGTGTLASKPRATTTFRDGSFTDEERAALQISCSLIWLESVRTKPELANIGREQFCMWLRLWHSLADLSMKRQDGGLESEDVDKLNKWRELLTLHINKGTRFPSLYSLRADIVELLPDDQRQPLVREMVTDRWRYAVLTKMDPKQQTRTLDPLGADNALAILAQVRPAISIVNGNLKIDAASQWARLLRSSESDILANAKSVGSVYFEETPTTTDDSAPNLTAHSLTGFVVAPNTILTFSNSHLAPFIVANGRPVSVPFKIPHSVIAEFNVGELRQRQNSFKITDVLYVKDDGDDSFAIMTIQGDDTPPPLKLALTKPNENLFGNYAAVIAYPTHASQPSEKFTVELLGADSTDDKVLKRIMPGRILEPLQAADNAEPDLSYDMSTAPGTTGGPVFDLQSNKVIALHTKGEWLDDKSGKVSSGIPIWKIMADPGMPQNVKATISAAQAL